MRSPSRLLESLRRTAPRPLDFGHLPTGLEELDRALGGGLPKGGLTELRGPPGAGLSSLARAAAVAATRRGELVAWVDPGQALDPRGAAEAGALLERWLWLRPPGLREAFEAVDLLLEGGGFPLVVLDLGLGDGARGAPPHTVWPRLAGRLREQPAALLLLTPTDLAGAFARASLEVRAGATEALPGTALPDRRTLRVEVRRNRGGPVGEAVELALEVGA